MKNIIEKKMAEAKKNITLSFWRNTILYLVTVLLWIAIARCFGNSIVEVIILGVIGYVVGVQVLSCHISKINSEFNQLKNVIDAASGIENDRKANEKYLDEILEENHIPHID